MDEETQITQSNYQKKREGEERISTSNEKHFFQQL